MYRTIVVKICEVASDLLEPLRSDWAHRAYWFFVETRATTLMKQRGVDPSVPECSCWYCLAGENDSDDLDADGDPLADSLGVDPEKLDNGRCGCDRPRWSVLPCGHCACGCACDGDGCAANKLWRDEQDAWCGCAQPGRNGVLSCGHCDCGYGCFEVVRNGSHAAMQKVPCA